VSILPTFYKRLLRSKISKAQKDTDDLTVFYCFWDLPPIKAAHKNVGDIVPRCQFHQHFSFYVRRSQKRKIWQSSHRPFALLGSMSVKAACKQVGEIDPRICCHGLEQQQLARGINLIILLLWSVFFVPTISKLPYSKATKQKKWFTGSKYSKVTSFLGCCQECMYGSIDRPLFLIKSNIKNYESMKQAKYLKDFKLNFWKFLSDKSKFILTKNTYKWCLKLALQNYIFLGLTSNSALSAVASQFFTWGKIWKKIEI